MKDLQWDFPYSSQRMPVFAANAVATSQPLAAQAGLRMLLMGGNAVDAALAAAITLTVVEPVSNGLGSDAFALIWDGKKLWGINGSGPSPAAWSWEYFAKYAEMPVTGWDAVTVPGAVDVWARLSERFGRLGFSKLFAPAIGYARHGFTVSPRIAEAWADAPEKYGRMPSFARTFLPGGKSPRAGQLFSCLPMANSLEKIADSHGESFYRGRLAEKIADCSAAGGGAMTMADLAAYRSEWVEPVSVAYQDVRLHEIPPNGQGLAALMALGILAHFPMKDFAPDAADSIHLQVEAMKIAFAAALFRSADPAFTDRDFHDFLTADFLAEKAGQIRKDKAAVPVQPPKDRGTVYLAAADEKGMMVSYIQSNFTGFGSGVVVPGTGISMQSRGYGFRLEKGHPNCVAGRKRPYHTIIPGFVTKGDGALMSFGVMGGHMQPQGHVQMMVRIFDCGQNPQSASDAPRWHICEDGTLALEKGISPEVVEELRKRGHEISDIDPYWGYGGAQIIYRLAGGYCAASDHRKDGQAVGF